MTDVGVRWHLQGGAGVGATNCIVGGTRVGGSDVAMAWGGTGVGAPITGVAMAGGVGGSDVAVA